MQQTMIIAMGEASKQNGNGFRAVVVDFGGIDDPVIKKAITTWLADN